MDFVSSATRGGKARDWFDQGNLQGLVGSLFNFVQMTEEDVSGFPSYFFTETIMPIDCSLSGGDLGHKR